MSNNKKSHHNPHSVQREAGVSKPEEKTPKAKGPVNVKNMTDTWFVQPSSKVRLDPGEVKPMNDDGWLFSQSKAGFLQKV